MNLLESGKARLFGATIGTCLITAVGVSSAFAQDATPEANGEATPTTGENAPPAPLFGGSAAEKTALAEQTRQVTDTITAVQADRDAVAGQTDLAAVDDLLAKAAALRDGAKTALDSDDISSAPGKLFAAQEVALAAEDLLRAQLADFGLPSQQAGASRSLVAAYNQIDETTGRLKETDNADAAALVTTAQSLYSQAYDLYNAGTYSSAAKTAEVAARVGSIADILTSNFTIAAPGMGTVVVGPGFAPPPGDQAQSVQILPGSDVQMVPGSPDIKPYPGGEAGVFEVSPDWGGKDGQTVKGGAPGMEANVVTIGPIGIGGEIKIGGGDFSTDSPLDVPAPDFT